MQWGELQGFAAPSAAQPSGRGGHSRGNGRQWHPQTQPHHSQHQSNRGGLCPRVTYNSYPNSQAGQGHGQGRGSHQQALGTVIEEQASTFNFAHEQAFAPAPAPAPQSRYKHSFLETGRSFVLQCLHYLNAGSGYPLLSKEKLLRLFDACLPNGRDEISLEDFVAAAEPTIRRVWEEKERKRGNLGKIETGPVKGFTGYLPDASPESWTPIDLSDAALTSRGLSHFAEAAEKAFSPLRDNTFVPQEHQVASELLTYYTPKSISIFPTQTQGQHTINSHLLNYNNFLTPKPLQPQTHNPFGAPSASNNMSSQSPTTERFLTEVSGIVRQRDGAKLQDFLVLEPPYAPIYELMIQELRNKWPKGREEVLQATCQQYLRGCLDDGQGPTWTALVHFMAQYFVFLRDVDVSNLLDTYNLLSELLQKANSALNHSTLGIIILPTVIAYSKVFARLAIGLDKRPELITHLRTQSSDEGGANETLPERAANIIRGAFVTCLNDRTGSASGLGANGKPEGKKVGIYVIANLCLKILFQCRKSRGAAQIFENIYNQSPLLSAYPAPQRTMYLYYLGRYLFSTNHFYRAQLALQEAYDQCHTQCLKQRRLILIFLMTSNIILGRFPSDHLYVRPEAAGLAERFKPLCRAIAKGDLATFRRLTDMDNDASSWFFRHRILLQLRNRCEVLVWRSLIRRTFILEGYQGDLNTRKAPTLDLNYPLRAFRLLERKALLGHHGDSGPGRGHTNWIFMRDQAPTSTADKDFEEVDEEEKVAVDPLPDMLEIESIFTSLINQGFLGGFISHAQLKFAIQGARKSGALKAGFPSPWSVIKARVEGDVEVPGWKRDIPITSGALNGFGNMGGFGAPTGGFGPGTVINLSGARPVGMS